MLNARDNGGGQECCLRTVDGVIVAHQMKGDMGCLKVRVPRNEHVTCGGGGWMHTSEPAARLPSAIAAERKGGGGTGLHGPAQLVLDQLQLLLEVAEMCFGRSAAAPHKLCTQGSAVVSSG